MQGLTLSGLGLWRHKVYREDLGMVALINVAVKIRCLRKFIWIFMKLCGEHTQGHL